jgi:hypothetical protein
VVEAPAVQDATEAARVPPGLPVDVVIVVADEDGYTDPAMKGPPYMWCWTGGPTWYYVRDYPIPLPWKRKG